MPGPRKSHRDLNRLSLVDRDVRTLIAELRVYASTAGSIDRDRAVAALATAYAAAGSAARCIVGNVAYDLAR
ncbi:MAG: hypothetical protein ACRDTA_29360 [Pseudonocardiaceae bacterium]